MSVPKRAAFRPRSFLHVGIARMGSSIAIWQRNRRAAGHPDSANSYFNASTRSFGVVEALSFETGCSDLSVWQPWLARKSRQNMEVAPRHADDVRHEWVPRKSDAEKHIGDSSLLEPLAK